MKSDAQRAAERELRAWRELADEIERAWRSRFGKLTPYIEIELERMRRGA